MAYLIIDQGRALESDLSDARVLNLIARGVHVIDLDEVESEPAPEPEKAPKTRKPKADEAPE